MSDFKHFAVAVNKNIQTMSSNGLFMTDVDKDTLWGIYLSSFPAGTNNLYRERTEHDCTCCKQFIRNIGGVVSIDGNLEVVSIWDGINLGNEYDIVAKALATYVKQHAIVDVYLNETSKVGLSHNHESKDGQIRTYNHFHTELNSRFVLRADAIPSKKGEIRQAIEVFERGLREITLSSAEIVLELIEQNSLYRGEENKSAVIGFVASKTTYDHVPENKRYAWTWLAGYRAHNHIPHGIRNTAIGTLLQDLSEGRDLEGAVKSFEDKVSGTNYKRPTALVTKSMIEKARQEVESLGLTDSLARRYATYDDINANNFLFTDLKAATPSTDPFDSLSGKVVNPTKQLSKVEEIHIDDFMTRVLPKAHSLEVLVENHHVPNLASIIAPAVPGAPSLFKWPNGMSWSYNGEVADSIKQRVKAAGGNVDGYLRVSLAWNNDDDLDLHMFDPSGVRTYFHNRKGYSAELDIDMNGLGGMSKTREPVENIIFTDERRLLDGVYRFDVNNFSQRETIDQGFTIEVEYKGEVKRFSHAGLRNKQTAECAVMIIAKNGVVQSIESNLDSVSLSQEVWGIKTGEFRKVQMVIESPNFWDGNAIGNKHTFFLLEGCVNPSATRGFYNEFLKPELEKHRKVFEVLGANMRVPYGPNQLSGLGFSSTVRNHVFVKVGGSFNRTVKVVF
ncbi:hypothetical protein DEEACLCL_00202 [Salmonella phage CRW-SP2]|nr:hypothetical protein DEEACLCL_00202 [Salmonella phage CRW-SP2]